MENEELKKKIINIINTKIIPSAMFHIAGKNYYETGEVLERIRIAKELIKEL